MTQPDELKPCPLKEALDIIADLPSANTRSTPDLRRILKLAAAWMLFHNGGGSPKLNEAIKALTPEDHQLLEAVLKE